MRNILEIQNLTVTVDNHKVIDDLSLNLPQNTVNIIFGPNGSGKSSLLHAISGDPRYQIVSGSMKFLNQDVLNMTSDKRAKLGIFLGWQNPIAIPGLTINAFLRTTLRQLNEKVITKNLYQSKVDSAFKMVSISTEFCSRNLNDGFSGGEKKRFELAQAILYQPKLVMLDEIDSGLDIEAINMVTKFINQKRSNQTLIVVTHDLNLLDKIKFDQIYLMNMGRIIKNGDFNIFNQLKSDGFSFKV